MTVQNSNYRADYTGNGSTTVFTIPFYFIDASHVRLMLTDTLTGVATALTLGTDYTVSGVGVGTGGSATLTVAPSATKHLAILRNMPYTQLTQYVENNPFPASSHETALDYLTMLVQQLLGLLTTSLTPQTCAVTVVGSVYTAPGNVAGVFVNGVLQPSTAYTLNGSVITFKYTLDSGDIVNALCTSY